MSNTKLLSQTEVADALGVRPSTIKYYTQLALLPYEQDGAGGHRRYELHEVKEAVDLINSLKADGLNMNGIIKEFAKNDLLYGEPDLYALNLTTKANND